MRKDSVGHLMPDGSDRQISLVDSKGRFSIGQLDVGPPEFIGRPVVYVGAKQVAALALLRPLVPLGAFGPR